MTHAATSPTGAAEGDTGAVGRLGDGPVLLGTVPGSDALRRSRTVGPPFD